MSSRGVTKWTAIIAALAIATSGVAACGDSGSSASSDDGAAKDATKAEAATLVEKATPRVDWFEPGPQFKVSKDLAGKKIAFISVQLNTPFSQLILKGLKDGAGLVGATVTASDSGGSPPEAARQIAQAVGQQAGAIVLQIPSAAVAAGLRQAKQAGIPVIELFDDAETGEPTAMQKELGVTANVDICWPCEGKLMAAAAVAEHGKDTDSVFISAKELVSAVKQEKAYTAELKRLCPDCKTETTYVPVAQWPSGIQAAAASALSDPSVNVMAPVYDLMIPSVQAAASAAQRSDEITTVSGDATAIGMAAVTKDPSTVMVSGSSTEWVGWLAIDQLLRHTNGEPPAKEAVLPVRAITKDIVREEKLDISKGANETAYFTDVDLKAKFQALWSLSSQ